MKKKVSSTTWSHHENMVINLRDWVGREILALQRDLVKEAPHLEDEPHVAEKISKLGDHRKILFEAMIDLVEIAERESKKVVKGPSSIKLVETDEFDSVDA